MKNEDVWEHTSKVVNGTLQDLQCDEIL
jgi:hypothetical protein